MNEEKRIETIRHIFDIGWNCCLTPCYAEWLSRILRKQYWKIKPIPFINEIVEEKRKDEFERAVYSCGYWEHAQGYGFKNQRIGKGCHHNLHQVIHCLNQYRGIPFEKIDIEQWFDAEKVDVLGEIEPEKYIVVELGQLSSYGKLCFIYNSLVKEFWFDGKGKYFYSLTAKGELPREERLEYTMLKFFKEKCSQNLGQYSNCSTYSREILRYCDLARYLALKKEE